MRNGWTAQEREKETEDHRGIGNTGRSKQIETNGQTDRHSAVMKEGYNRQPISMADWKMTVYVHYVTCIV